MDGPGELIGLSAHAPATHGDAMQFTVTDLYFIIQILALTQDTNPPSFVKWIESRSIYIFMR